MEVVRDASLIFVCPAGACFQAIEGPWGQQLPQALEVQLSNFLYNLVCTSRTELHKRLMYRKPHKHFGLSEKERASIRLPWSSELPSTFDDYERALPGA